MYKQYIRRSSRVLFSLQQKADKYDWARYHHQQVTENRETFTNSIFDKLTALDPANYYSKLFKDKIDLQLSNMMNNL